MTWLRCILLAVVAVTGVSLLRHGRTDAQTKDDKLPDKVSYYKDVRPIFQQHCIRICTSTRERRVAQTWTRCIAAAGCFAQPIERRETIEEASEAIFDYCSDCDHSWSRRIR